MKQDLAKHQFGNLLWSTQMSRGLWFLFPARHGVLSTAHSGQATFGSSGSYERDLLAVYRTFSSLFLISASKCGHQCCKHRLFHAHYGVWQIHLCARESRRYSSGSDHWYERHRQPSEEADLCRLRNHEPHQQGYCTQRSATDAIAQGSWDSEINTRQLFVLVIIISTKKS